MRKLVIMALAATLTACNNAKLPDVDKHITNAKPKSVKQIRGCNVVGLNPKSHQSLKDGLCKLSRKFGRVMVVSTCRTDAYNRRINGAKNSYHLHRKGCRASDVVIAGVSGKRIVNWWAANVGGGRGQYRCRPFVHLDTGPNRAWYWKTKCK